MVIALFDGSQVDEGTVWEIGYFYGKKSPGQKMIGIRTDFRRAEVIKHPLADQEHKRLTPAQSKHDRRRTRPAFLLN